MCGAGNFPGSCQTRSVSSLFLCSARPPGRGGSLCVEFVRLSSLCACHLGPLACGLRGGGGFTRLSARGMRCLWHAPGGVWPAGASCNGFVTQWKSVRLITCCIPAVSSRLRGARWLRDACGVVLDNAATMAPAGEHFLNQPNCFCRVRSLPLDSIPPPPVGTCSWFLHVRSRGVLGYLFLPSRRAGGDAARSLTR